MPEAQPRPWSWQAFLDWQAQQPVRHEFLDGQVYAMGGGTAAHDTIANNLRDALRAALRGRPCRPHGPDMMVATGTGNGRYPDALIDCGRFVPTALHAQEPAAVFALLSRSTAWVDQSLKLRDYDATPSITHYVLISQDEKRAMVYTRGADGRLDIRNAALVDGADGEIALPGLDLVLRLGPLYEGLDA
jgi:Uma2 family endonuclease